MINIAVVTHGEFGAYLIEAAEGIVGRQPHGVRAVSISSRLSVAEISARVRRVIEEARAGADGVVIFTDMPGGTPSNLSFPVIKDLAGVEMVSGVNLYMLVSAFSNRDKLPLGPFVEKIIADGQKSIRDIRSMLLQKAR